MPIIFNNGLEYMVNIPPDMPIIRTPSAVYHKEQVDELLGFKVGDMAIATAAFGHNFPTNALVKVVFIDYNRICKELEFLLDSQLSISDISSADATLVVKRIYNKIQKDSPFGCVIQNDPSYKEGHNLDQRIRDFRLGGPDTNKGQWMQLNEIQKVKTYLDLEKMPIPRTPATGIPEGYSYLETSKSGELIHSYMVTSDKNKYICLSAGKYSLRDSVGMANRSHTLKKSPTAVEKICPIKIISAVKSGELFGLKNIKRALENKQLNRGQYTLSLNYVHKKDGKTYDTVLVYDEKGDRNLRFLASDCKFFIPHAKGFTPAKDRSLRVGRKALCIKTNQLNLKHKEEVTIETIRDKKTMIIRDESGKRHLVPIKQFKIK